MYVLGYHNKALNKHAVKYAGGNCGPRGYVGNMPSDPQIKLLWVLCSLVDQHAVPQ